MPTRRRPRKSVRAAPPSPRRVELRIDGRAVPLVVRRDPRARQLILRIDGDADTAVVTLPSRVPLREGLALARSKADWILAQLASLPPRVPFAPGAKVPILGVEHRVHHAAAGDRPVWRRGRRLFVSGRAEHLARRLRDWLRTLAHAELARRADAKARRLGRRIARITIRDTRWRWGSCAEGDRLSFCWRLIMAPEPVLDYVVAHEVAHLVHRDHGPRFWKVVAELNGDVRAARAWLGRHGASLHRYG